MAQIWEYIKIAVMNIRSNKGRSILTMLGIVIGIASVIMVMAIGNGVRGQINDELESIGSGMIELYLDTTLETTTMRFMQDDFDLIQDRVAHVKGVTPVLGGWGSAAGRSSKEDILRKKRRTAAAGSVSFRKATR